MKIFDFFRRKKERKPVVLKDLTKFELYRVRGERRVAACAFFSRVEFACDERRFSDPNRRARRRRRKFSTFFTSPV